MTRRFLFVCLTAVLAAVLLLSVAPVSAGTPKIPFAADDTIEEIRVKIEANGYGFTVDHNRIFDMGPEERGRLFKRRPSVPTAEAMEKCADQSGGALRLWRTALPSALDWRNYEGRAYIGPVRDQGNCGSCYSFGAAAAAEGAYNLARNLYDENLVDFSEAYIAWCLGALPEYAAHFYGCDGADYDYMELQALTEVGVADEADFPYQDDFAGACPYAGPTTMFRSWHRVPCGDIEAIKLAIMNYGVVDAAVMVTAAFAAYSGGVYEDTLTACDGDPCAYTPTDHAISLVGWNDNGDAENEGYWILRNSWGSGWGENGYMRIKYRSAVVSCAVSYMVPSVPRAVLSASPAVVSDTSATITGQINPNGAETSCRVEYGLTPACELATAERTLAAGDDPVNVELTMTGLQAGATYYYRLTATNASGSGASMDETLATAQAGHRVVNGVDFGPDSAVLTNVWMPISEGDTWVFEGPAGRVSVIAQGKEDVFGVNCLKVSIHGNLVWLAQDTAGNIHIFRYRDADGTYTVESYTEFPNYWLPREPGTVANWTWTAGSFGPVQAAVQPAADETAGDRRAAGGESLTVATTFPDSSWVNWEYRSGSGLVGFEDETGAYTLTAASGGGGGSGGCFISTGR